MNPLSDDMNVLRTDLALGLLHSLRNNLAQGADSVRLFEVASVFTPDPDSETTARETPRLGIILHGTRFEQAWPHPQEDLDYLDLKGLVEHLFASFSLPEGIFSLAEDAGDMAPAWLAPCVRITVNGEGVGWMGKVKPDAADPYHAKKAVWLAEIDLDRLYRLQQALSVRFARLPVFPPVRRDITVIAPPEVMAGAIIEAIRNQRPPLLSSVQLIDCFAPEGRKERNLTCRLTFRHAGRTLKDAEADKGREAIAEFLQKTLPVRV
jgi:phenylalanyl-tRNA synthetase beta chain